MELETRVNNKTRPGNQSMCGNNLSVFVIVVTLVEARAKEREKIKLCHFFSKKKKKRILSVLKIIE